MNIKELAEQAGIFTNKTSGELHGYIHSLERFAELVAKQTHTNNKAKWYQEGYEAGRHDERESCARLCDLVAKEADETDGLATYIGKGIRARGEK